MSSRVLRKTALLSAGVTAYGTAVYLFYSFYAPDKSTHGGAHGAQNESHCHSYTEASNRVETFDHIAHFYDIEISREEVLMGLPLLRRALLYFHSKSGTLLEVASGTGRNLGYYPKQVSKIILTDSSEKMLLQARRKLKSDPDPRINLFVADASKITEFYPPNSFDTVLDTFGLCSFNDPVLVLKELQRVCKPDGKVLLLEHGTSKNYKFVAQILDKHAQRHAQNWGCVWNRDLDAILEESGLEIEKKGVYHFGTTYYVVARPSARVKADEVKVRRNAMEIVSSEDVHNQLTLWRRFRSRIFRKVNEQDK